jgi:hypothetical protein
VVIIIIIIIIDNFSEYNETFKLQIDRKSRSFARVLERKGIKFDIYYKRYVRGHCFKQKKKSKYFGLTSVGDK